MISAIIFKSIKQTGGIRDLSKVPNTIFVYDYNFNLKKIINMSMPILRIAAKGDSNTLYAIGIDLETTIRSEYNPLSFS